MWDIATSVKAVTTSESATTSSLWDFTVSTQAVTVSTHVVAGNVVAATCAECDSQVTCVLLQPLSQLV